MPLLRLETSAALHKRKALLASLSKAVAETIGKPEQYVMVTAGQAAMLMSGKPGDGAFVDMAVVGAAPCQCFSPGGNQTTSPGRISSIGPPQRCTRPQPAVTISV